MNYQLMPGLGPDGGIGTPFGSIAKSSLDLSRFEVSIIHLPLVSSRIGRASDPWKTERSMAMTKTR